MPIVAVGAVGAVIAALMALLLIYGLQLLGRAVAHLVPNWHIPGLGNIRHAVESAIGSVLSAIYNLLAAAVKPIENWILAPWHAINALVSGIIATAHEIYHTIVAVKHYAGQIYSSLYHFIGNRIAAVVSLAHFLYSQAVALAHSVYNSLYHFIGNRVTALEHYIQYLVGHAEAYALSLYHAAVAEAHHLYDLAIHNANAYARAAAAGAIGALITDVTHAVRIPWIEVTDEVKALEGILATDLPDIRALVRAIPRAIPIDIATALAGGLAIDRVLLRYLRRCGVPNCRNLGGFGNLLKDLTGLAEGAALLGLLAEAVRDPEGTAEEIGTLIGGTVHTAARVLTSAVEA